MTREQVLDLIDRWEYAFAQRDMTTYASLYSEQAMLESPLVGSVQGRESIVRATLGLLTAFPDATFTPEPPIVDGDRVAIASRVAGTHEGAILGLAPTHRPFKFPITFFLEVRDGVITRDRRVYDFTGLLVQIGALKARPADL
jgi:steroid delta-isomerase-like uncharacterized protein